ncbi:hypothetical protein LTR33_017407, partial [Friedmanniomyces endolithicus]
EIKEREVIPEEEVGMGGPEGRVYWPPGMEEWLRPKKREVKKKVDSVDDGGKRKAQMRREADTAYRIREAEKAAAKAIAEEDVAEESMGEGEDGVEVTAATKKARAAMRKKATADRVKVAAKAGMEEAKRMAKEAAREAKAAAGGAGVLKGEVKGKRVRVKKEEVEEVAVPTPSPSVEEDDAEDFEGEESNEHSAPPAIKRSSAAASRKTSGRAAKTKKVSYAEDDEDAETAEA